MKSFDFLFHTCLFCNNTSISFIPKVNIKASLDAFCVDMLDLNSSFVVHFICQYRNDCVLFSVHGLLIIMAICPQSKDPTSVQLLRRTAVVPLVKSCTHVWAG